MSRSKPLRRDPERVELLTSGVTRAAQRLRLFPGVVLPQSCPIGTALRDTERAMSEENIELVRQGYEAWNRGDVDAWLELLDPEIEFRTAQLFSDTDAVYRGHEGMKKFWHTFREPWETVLIKVERIESIGEDRVLALFRFLGRGRGSGAEVTVQYANLFTIEDGVASRCVGFSDWGEALAAAGLQE